MARNNAVIDEADSKSPGPFVKEFDAYNAHHLKGYQSNAGLSKLHALQVLKCCRILTVLALIA